MGTGLIAGRYRYIDWARGIAALLMIEAHTVDSWTRSADRGTIAFRDLTILGGFAAPLFLWLAGLSVALSAARTARTGGSRRAAMEAVCRRGLEIFILAFLFRLQAFVVSPGGPAIALFRVDILNVIGPAIVAAGALWALAASSSVRSAAFGIAAVAVAFATQPVRQSPALSALPALVQWYLRPAGEHTTFTLLPWTGFVFAGAAAGVLLAESKQAAVLKLHGRFAAVGAVLVATGMYGAVHADVSAQTTFWTSSPAFFAIRVGVLMLAFAGLFAVDRWDSRRAGPPGSTDRRVGWLMRFGQSSLFVYWIHVELVYGYATWPIHRALPVPATLVACAGFSGLMYQAVVARDRVRWNGVARWMRRVSPVGSLGRAGQVESIGR